MAISIQTSKTYLLKLSIPIFFSNLAIPFASLVDTGLMGHLNNVEFLAAISIATSVLAMVYWSFGFLRMGTVGIISQAFSRKDYIKITQVIIRNLLLAFFIGFMIIFFKDLILFSIKNFFSISEKTFILIENYISIRVLSAPAELIIYVLTGFYLGLQKTNISSLMISIFCIGNAILSSILVINYDLEIFGVALGTVIAAYVTISIFLILAYTQLENKLKSSLRYKKIFNPAELLQLLNINFNIFIRTIILTFSFLWVTYQGSKMGENYLAVNAILMQFIVMASFFLDAYAFSTEAIVGYTIGRRSKNSFLTVVSNSFKLSIFSGLIISVIYLLSFQFIVNLLTDLDYLKFLAFNYFFWIIIIPPVASVCYQFDGIFIGASQTAEMRNAMVVSGVLFIISSQLLVSNFGNHGLWLSLLFFMIVRSVTLNYYFNRIFKKF